VPTAVSRCSSVGTATGLPGWPPRVLFYTLSRLAVRPPVFDSTGAMSTIASDLVVKQITYPQVSGQTWLRNE